jgi:hypothetical protein
MLTYSMRKPCRGVGTLVLDNKIKVALCVVVEYVLCPARGGQPAGREGGREPPCSCLRQARSKRGCSSLQFLPAQSKA